MFSPLCWRHVPIISIHQVDTSSEKGASHFVVSCLPQKIPRGDRCFKELVSRWLKLKPSLKPNRVQLQVQLQGLSDATSNPRLGECCLTPTCRCHFRHKRSKHSKNIKKLYFIRMFISANIFTYRYNSVYSKKLRSCIQFSEIQIILLYINIALEESSELVLCTFDRQWTKICKLL